MQDSQIIDYLNNSIDRHFLILLFKKKTLKKIIQRYIKLTAVILKCN